MEWKILGNFDHFDGNFEKYFLETLPSGPSFLIGCSLLRIKWTQSLWQFPSRRLLIFQLR